ncbi:transporter substrate-binding domain-containing protein, partial [Thermocatellispora tengchongensis]
GAAPAAALEQFTDKIMPMDSYANAVQAVNANRAIAEFADLPTAESQALADDSLKIIVPEPAIFQSSTGYGVPASADQRSLQIVNIAIDRAKSEGVLTKAYAESNYVEADNLGDLRKK